MDSKVKSAQQANDILILGLKLDSSASELLNWTLANFVSAGDSIIALHVAPLTAHADTLRNNKESTTRRTEACIESISGVYETFCSIKQVDLQVRVTEGSSLRRALVGEAKKYNASKLILGHASDKPHVRPSFSLAKYCTRRLPVTCSVIVIQHGQVTFQREGSIKEFGDNSSRVFQTLQKTLQSHNRKYNNLDGKMIGLMSPSSEAEIDHEDFGNVLCPWPLPTRFLESPVSVLQLHKYPSWNKRSEFSLDSPLSLSSPIECSMRENQCGINYPSEYDERNNKDSVCHSHRSLEDCFTETEGTGFARDQSCNSLEKLDSVEHPLKIISPLADQENAKSCGAPAIKGPKAAMCLKDPAAEENDLHPIGWPLLCRQFHANLEPVKKTSRKMSVVEWALQLPDRQRDISNHQANSLEAHDSITPLQSNSQNIRHGQQEWEKSKEPQSVCAPLECCRDTTISRIAKIFSMRPCRQFQMEDLEAATNNFSPEKMVGKGGCSQVYQGVIQEDIRIAVKCLNGSATEDQFINEIEIMCNLEHKNIVQLMGYCIDAKQQMLVYNFASDGNLEQKLHGGKGKTVLPWEARNYIAVGVADALTYLHDGCRQPMVHMDVKSSNILLLSDLEPQLTDFGLAKCLPSSSLQMTCSDVVGTFGYLAPEYFMFGKVSPKTDVYSFGVVLLELITGRCPIDNTRSKGEKNLVIWAKPLLEDESNAERLIDPRLEGCYDPNQLKNMMIAAALCLRQSPQTRPRMTRILELLKGESQGVEHINKQDSVYKESDDGCDLPNYGEIDIRTHLAIALLGLDDDAASQASMDHSMNFAHSNKYLEEYLGGRFSRSSSFE
ncbi:hypothetical protein KP509_32G062100 [Ceratopteris richardii]|uniref:Protein kinase domain-containing protein n=1 Tax=Ceratopteris richardii TaxID=49495 RepID=A0A8T2QUB6_CERRI|nr:hypothetical protein KP509_32G062100 [Ceratopteris richardii]